jgi:hypothetical protein
LNAQSSFAATLTNIGDRERFQIAADDYQRELDSLSSADTTSADTSAPSHEVAAKSEPDTTAPSDAIAASIDGEAITSTNDRASQETDWLHRRLAILAGVARSVMKRSNAIGIPTLPRMSMIFVAIIITAIGTLIGLFVFAAFTL